MLNPIQFHNIAARERAPGIGPKAPPPSADFASVFEATLQPSKEIVFSAHAAQRLEERGIGLTPFQTEAIARALDDASSKGARESLFLVDDLALLVSVPNRTVITAFEPKHGENAVVTNIDSVVIVAGENSSSARTQGIGPDPFGGARVPRID